MLNATTQIRRTVVLAGALAAVAAPGASARVPDARPVLPRRPTAAHGAEPPPQHPRWPTSRPAARRSPPRRGAAANPATIIEVSSPDDGGFDLPSAGIGAAVPLTLVLIEVAGRWVLRRRRDNEVRHQLV